MKTTLLLLTAITLHAEVPKLSFEKVTAIAHGDLIEERFRASEGTEQIWIVSTDDPAKRHLLYTHHRRAELVFSNDNAWLAINDHCGSAGSSLMLYRRKDPPVYEKVDDLTHAAWKFFNERNGLKVAATGKSEDVQRHDRELGLGATPFDHRYIDAISWVGTDPPTLLIRLSGHLSGPAGLIHGTQGWYCLYDMRGKTFTTDLDDLNRRNTLIAPR